MKIFILFFVLLLSSQLVFSQVFSNDDLTISQLEDDLWVIETVDNTTMYIVVGKEKVMLVDTGTKCQKLDKVVKKITQKPLYVVVTHIHVDHAGNISDFDEIYFHKDDEVLLDRLKAPYEGKVNPLKDGDVFDLGGKKIEVKHMSGHTPGSIVLIDQQSGNCYSGDAFGSGQVWCQLWPFSTMKIYAKSCKKMLKLMDSGITKIYCGHYPYVKKSYGKSYIQDMYDLAVMIDKGKQPTPEPHPYKIPVIGAKNPMMLTYQSATIVYDPERIKKVKKNEKTVN